MAEMNPASQEEESASPGLKHKVVKKKQYEFEKLNLGENKEVLEENHKKSFKDYLHWIIIGLVLIVLVVLVFAFDII